VRVINRFEVIFAEAGTFFEDFQILSSIPLGVMQIMGSLKRDFFCNFNHGLRHKNLKGNELSAIVNYSGNINQFDGLGFIEKNNKMTD
jgi:hypothetical protein